MSRSLIDEVCTLPLRDVEERSALPPCATMAEFVAPNASGRSFEILPGIRQPASAWNRDCVAAKGGAPIPSWWNDDPIIESDAVCLFRVRDAFYFPAYGAIITSRGEVMQHSAAQARYLTPDLSGLPYMDKSGAEIRLGPPQVPTLDRVIVTMALGAVRNYGHLVCDCLSTSAVLSALPELAGYRYAFPTLKPWQKRHLELVGIGFPTELDGPLYRVADVIFSSGMRRFLHHPNVNYRTLRDVELRSCARGSRSFRRIYVSRAEITRKFPLLRRFLSEHKVQERLSEWGFTILTPENHSVDEQIDLFNKAEVIVGCSGAAMANTMYCAPGTTVVEIMPIVDGLSGQRWVQNICAINGLRWGPYFCAGYRPEPEIRQGRSHLGYSFDANVDDLVAFIRGFL